MSKHGKRKRVRAFEVIGSIAILQSSNEEKSRAKAIAQQILKENKYVKTVALKSERIKGRLRKRKLKIIAGIKNLETTHRESDCLMKLDAGTCYFSPRLSNERIEIAKEVKGKKKVLVMFAGVAPFALVIAKQNPKAEITAVELNREACRYAEENVKLNKFENIKIIQGDVKKIIKKGDVDNRKNLDRFLGHRKSKDFLWKKLGSYYFDFVVMPRPQLKETFLKQAFQASKKGTKIFYYDFSKQDEIESKIKAIKEEAKKAKKRIKILKIKKAGEIAPYKFRIRVDFKVL